MRLLLSIVLASAGLALFAGPQSGDEVFYPGYIIKDGQRKVVVFELPYSNIRQTPKYEKVQREVHYQDSLGNAVKVLPNDVDEIGFVVNGDSLRFVSVYSNLELGGRSDDGTGLPKVFLKVEIQGDLSLYTAYFKIPAPNGGDWSALPVLQRKGDILYKPPKLGFRKAMISYLGECAGIDVALDKRDYKMANVGQLVKYYNQVCSFR